MTRIFQIVFGTRVVTSTEQTPVEPGAAVAGGHAASLLHAAREESASERFPLPPSGLLVVVVFVFPQPSQNLVPGGRDEGKHDMYSSIHPGRVI